MVIQDLQRFLESQVPGACVPVDLLKIAKSVGIRRGNQRNVPRGGYGGPTPLTLVVDGEYCLDRLYGGFYSDWVCGGQWNRMVQFLAVLMQTVQNNNIELAVFFNGALEQQRLNEWSRQECSLRKNINLVLKHVTVKGTPPPKVWWVAPVGLRTCLRMALRHLNIQVLCTMDDHHQEVIAFCRENNYHGVMAEDAEYIIFDPPRYFSSHQLKLTYKGSLETKEFILDEVAKGLGLQRNYFCLLAALLGNYLLTETDLWDFYTSLIPGYDKQQTPQEDVIQAVVKFIVNRCDVNNLLTIGAQVFGSVSDPRVAKFKESVQYFLNGTKDGFLRYKPFPSGRRDGGPRHPHQHSIHRPEIHEPKHSEGLGRPDLTLKGEGLLGLPALGLAVVPERENGDSGTGSSSNRSCNMNLVAPPQIVIEVTGPGSPQSSSRGGSGSGSLSPDAAQLEQVLESRLGGFTIVVTGEDDEPQQLQEDVDSEEKDEEENRKVGEGHLTVITVGAKEEEEEEGRKGDLTVQPTDLDDHDHDSGILCGGCLGSTASGSPGASLLLSSSSSSSNSSAASPYRLTPDVSWAAQVYRSNHTSKNPVLPKRLVFPPMHQPCEDAAKHDAVFHNAGNPCPQALSRKQSSSPVDGGQEPGPQIDPNPLPLPPVPHEVMRTASERHQKGLMCPWIYQVLTQGEVKFGVCMEDESTDDLPNAVLFYRSVRQCVYAILYNLHHHSFMSRKAKEEGHKGLATEVPEVKIREWVYTKNNPYRTADIVDATPIDWAVPTVQRLWFGSVIDDKKRRLRAFLSCMRSDSPLMLYTSNVPQHLLIMATVLRYIMSNPDGPVLRRQELDAFLVTAFSPDLTNAHYLQDLQLHVVTARGCQLAALFMMGVETALFANDACGAPVPWLMCCPWLFFDGKLFHEKLVRAHYARTLREVCEGDMDLVVKVESCRRAVLENIKVEYARPSLFIPPVGCHKVRPPPPHPGLSHNAGRGRGRGAPDRTNAHPGGGVGRMFSRGGQLQVAGVVVGSWGPNYGSNGNDSRPPRGFRPPQYSSNGRDMGGNMQGRGEPSRLSRATRGRPTVLAKRRTIKKREVRLNKGRGVAVESPGNSHPPGMREVLVMPGSGYNNHTPVGEEGEGVTSYSAHPPQTHSSSGIKSPDSGVNVSILE
ncbi:constitutive coactivator of PPAR-gamma-like protein 1 isoform X3 [Homarus americanus]|uniref:constitutive coactivator of PPAR-gamma-like protein 1 isoform X3 n=1 Tax=Homarus americanus TaxID=6706 RepID=UPI001C485FB1|nr:constitutive coactivator of PPAR-gamma-like protein 1 isoform X3 [Homarus americanus]